MYDVFISYSSEDRSWAEAIEERLNSAGITNFRDKTRLAVGEPYQEALFQALDVSENLILIWSAKARTGRGEWKEWVITERAEFRARHPKGKIIPILLDDEQPKVDAHTHMLTQLRDSGTTPDQVDEALWTNLLDQIRQVVFTDRLEIQCYIMACKETEFQSLNQNDNLQTRLNELGLNFQDVLQWYGADRTNWKPAGKKPLTQLLSEMQTTLTDVLSDQGVPESYRNKQIQINTALEKLWDSDDDVVDAEVNRLKRLNFAWFFIDPFSLYHERIGKVSSRIIQCLEENSRLNAFVIDPIGYLYDRTPLRKKLALECSGLYKLLVKPNISPSQTRSIGAIDAWHEDDFERVFRMNLRRQAKEAAKKSESRHRTRESRFTGFHTGGA